MKTIKPTKTQKIDKNLVYTMVAVMTIWILFFLIAYLIWRQELNSSIGILGDSFGILNALFSGLAFAGLLYTIRLQKIELNETREVFKKQSEIFLQQKFDDSFYKQLDMHRQIREEVLSFKIGRVSFFEHIFHHLTSIDMNRNDQSSIINSIKQVFKDGRGADDFSRYSRYVYSLMTILAQLKQKKLQLNIVPLDYIAVIRSQMDAREQYIVIIYAVTQKEYMDILFGADFIDEFDIETLIEPKFLPLFKPYFRT